MRAAVRGAKSSAGRDGRACHGLGVVQRPGAYLTDRVRRVLCCDNWIEYFRGWNYAEWAEILAAGMTEEERTAVRRARLTRESRWDHRSS